MHVRGTYADINIASAYVFIWISESVKVCVIRVKEMYDWILLREYSNLLCTHLYASAQNKLKWAPQLLLQAKLCTYGI